ncbi:ketoacyl-ACP synthase III [Metabacillus malikii]|uniref:Beta-ketoacyl-[acyl-carrier-protein] synthase III n=1 Tax=Metabacillus malikii TaxID=1504265 RepID=A0ABT9ZI05_9BACI|nr:ketoacyl-ACP synthase III [Metabacillus malikii]MDQ0231910.1 3-oxoacyl-[acyl-carrier-protein] synthase-3 [Metabacillus malikii]
MISKARITAIGTYVPEKIITNHDLEKLVDTNDEWITRRTGIKERRFAKENEYTSDLSIKAIENLAERYNKTLDDVDLIIVCTLTPDYITPSVASYIQGKLGLKQAGAIDINAACAGFTYGLHLANGLITAGLHKKVIVVGAEVLSKITDFTDRTTCILFGDGAGAMLLEHDSEGSFLSSYNSSEGEKAINLYGTNISDIMFNTALLHKRQLVQNGREVYKWAVSSVPKGMQIVCQNAAFPIEKVDWFVPHSANLRMIESICERSKVPIQKTLTSLVHYGNTSAASIPLALDIGIKEGKVKDGEHILLYGFGGGLAQSGHLIKWG